MKFKEAFKRLRKDGFGIYRKGWGLNAVCHINVDEFVLINDSDNTRRVLTLTYKDLIANDWEIVVRASKSSMET
jgi:hypothetical protein